MSGIPSIPFVPGTYDYRPGERIADLIMRGGELQAQRQARGGEIWGGAINQLGQIGQQAYDKHKQDEEQSQVGGAVSAAMSPQYPSATKPVPGSASDVPDPGANHIQAILDNVDPKLRPSVMKGIQDFNAAQDVADERRSRIAQAQRASQQADADAAATLAHGVIAHKFLDGPDGGLGALTSAATIAKAKGAPWASAWDTELQQATQAMQQAGGDPGAVKAVADTVRQHFGPRLAQLEMAASQGLQEQWKKDNTPIKLGEGDTLVNPNDFSTVAKGAEKPVNLQHVETDKGIQSFDPSKGTLGPVIGKGKPNAAMVQIGPGLSDPALDAAALRYSKDGTLPAIGRGGQGVAQRDKIINRAAEMFPGLDVAANKATLGADSASLKKLQPQVDAVTAFENTAKKNSAILQDAMKRIPDLGSKYLNRPWRSLKDNLGSEDMARFNAIRQSVQNEYARIISSPGLAGTMSDSARKEAEVLLSDSATVGQIKRSLETLQQEAENRRVSYEQQITDIKGRLKGDTGGSTVGRFKVTVE